jgi:hypothetical protein
MVIPTKSKRADNLLDDLGSDRHEDQIGGVKDALVA